MRMRYAVKGRRTIVVAGKSYGPGFLLPADISEADVKRLVMLGVVQAFDGSAIPGVDPTAGEKPKGTVNTSLFTLNPADIKAKSLDELNAMLVERGAEPAKTVGAAVLALSKDFTG